MKDALLIKTKAFPAAAATNNTDTIDLGASAPVAGIKPGEVDLRISWPLLSALVDTKNIVFTVQDSANDSAYAAVGMAYTITGAGGAGVAAGSVTLRLPPSMRRYLRVYAAVDSGGGSLTASSYTVELVAH